MSNLKVIEGSMAIYSFAFSCSLCVIQIGGSSCKERCLFQWAQVRKSRATMANILSLTHSAEIM